MGAGESKPPPEEASATSTAPSQAPQVPGATQLYQYQTSSGSWELSAPSIVPHFFNPNEDQPGQTSWSLEAGSMEIAVTDSYSYQSNAQRVTLSDLETGQIWALKFPSLGAAERFVEEYTHKLFENTYSKPYTAANFQKQYGADTVMGDGGPEGADSQQQWAAQEPQPPPTAVKRERQRREQEITQREAIKGMKMGAGDRSYLVRDGEIDVLRNVYGGVERADVSFNLTPSKRGSSGLAATSSPSYTPSKMLLTHAEKRMNMLTPSQGAKVANADLETGKVVSEWTFQKDGVDVEMRDISNDSKAAQLDSRDTFLGVGQNRLVKWDMRDPRGVVQQLDSPVVGYESGKDYSRGTNFTCMATTGDGCIAVGAQDGQVRMYSDKNVGQIAKTAIPGLGLPITAIDATFDGAWVLATTDKYLMVVNASFKDKKSGADSNAFTKRMGQQGPKPRLLRLKPEDQALTQGAPFQKGRFTWVTEADRKEKWIVVSIGKYSVLWNFRTVKLATPEMVSYGGLTTITNYHLIPKQEDVVESQFMHDKFSSPTGVTGGSYSSPMVVATKRRVFSLADEDDSD